MTSTTTSSLDSKFTNLTLPIKMTKSTTSSRPDSDSSLALSTTSTTSATSITSATTISSTATTTSTASIASPPPPASPTWPASPPAPTATTSQPCVNDLPDSTAESAHIPKFEFETAIYIPGLATGLPQDIATFARVRTSTDQVLVDVDIALNVPYFPRKPLHIVTLRRGDRVCLWNPGWKEGEKGLKDSRWNRPDGVKELCAVLRRW